MPEIVHLPNTASTEAIIEVMARDGGVIVDDVLDGPAVDRLLSELRPYLDATERGRDDFAGHKTARTGALAARSQAFRELATSDLCVNLAEEFLKPWAARIQLHVTQVIRILPGQGSQPLHRDLQVWSPHLFKIKNLEPQLNSMWALTDFTKENGATHIVPGSGSWPPTRQAEEHEVAQAEMSRGSVLFFTGRVIHGGGQNNTSSERIGMLMDYALGWLRQEENQYLCCPSDIAKDFDPKLQSLLGYTRGNFGLGYYSDPYGIVKDRGLLAPELAVGRNDPGKMLWPEDEYDEEYLMV